MSSLPSFNFEVEFVIVVYVRARSVVVVILLFNTLASIFDGEDGLAALKDAWDVRKDVRDDTAPKAMSDCDWLERDKDRIGLCFLRDRPTTASNLTSG